MHFKNLNHYASLMGRRQTRAALEELSRDYLANLPEWPLDVDMHAIHRKVQLAETEPSRWCYNRPNPDKSTWDPEAHFARFAIQIKEDQVWAFRHAWSDRQIDVADQADRYVLIYQAYRMVRVVRGSRKLQTDYNWFSPVSEVSE